ncbi:hypothetical protein NC651_024855 [Populus alba x Populus x berolinensis]|nr:hypothetical protein NC651_024855 [Populus alba x Populus x berolinensis]
MEQVKGVVKHIVLAKFKEGVPEEEIGETHKRLRQSAQPHRTHEVFPVLGMKYLVLLVLGCFLVLLVLLSAMGTDVSIENLHQGFTHIFEVTFETLDGRSAYVAHPAHVDFGTAFLTILEKIVVVDFVPTLVKL